MKESIFTKIFLNKISSFKIIEDVYSVAILDTKPLHQGHVLVFPKDQVDSIQKLSVFKYISMMRLVRRLSYCLQIVFNTNRVGVIISGFDITNHLHIHLIPANEEEDLNFSNKRIHINREELFVLKNKISYQLSIIKTF